MRARTRKHFSGSFKATVTCEAIRAVKMVHEMAQEYGVHPTHVGLWKKELHEQAADIFDAKRGPKPADPSASPEWCYFRDRAAEDGAGLAQEKVERLWRSQYGESLQ